ncbi:MAG: hypothetical protein Q8S13_07095, partial [Dehalococcoidia bacterium]|nr:hypothetical protein [Dehalococcoidia bacterium]
DGDGGSTPGGRGVITTQLREDVEALRRITRLGQGLDAPWMRELRAIRDRLEGMADNLDGCGIVRVEASRPQTVYELAGRSTCLHATILAEFGDGTREDPYVVAVSIGPAGRTREVLLISRRELARVLFPVATPGSDRA